MGEPSAYLSAIEVAPLLGRTIGGKFVVERLLGARAMGAIYRAHQTALERAVRHLVFAASSSVAVALTACSSLAARPDTIDPATLSRDVRVDYEVFAQRCSKCHPLSRPLNSGIIDDDHWAMYVARMRRQPASGISAEDARVILRFLHYYSLEQIHKNQVHAGDPPATPATRPLPPSGSVPAATPLPPTPE